MPMKNWAALRWRRDPQDDPDAAAEPQWIEASDTAGFPVRVVEPDEPLTIRDMLRMNVDVAAWLAAEGRVFYASDADQNDLVTGQTSYADTTPSFSLRVPAGTVAIPLLMSLGQTGTVAGDTISVIVEIDNADRYSSGGASETIFNSRTGGAGLPTPQCTLFSTPTVVTGYGIRVMGINLAQDVAPAEGISNEVIWTPTGPDFLVGPANLNVYTYAGTTGPTWFWTFKWAEFPLARLGF